MGLTVYDVVTRLAVLAAGVWVLWLVFAPRYLFVIRVRDGVPQLAKGKVAATFLEQVREVCADASVTNAWVGGVVKRKRVTLAFSRRIPPPYRQRLRNLWGIGG